MLFRQASVLDELAHLERTMDQLYRQVEGRRAQAGQGLDGFTVRRHEQGWTLTADVPGLSAADLKVEVRDGKLTLGAERQVSVPEGFEPLHRERRSWSLSRTLILPREVDPTRIEARLADGRLTLELPRAATPATRVITVQS